MKALIVGLVSLMSITSYAGGERGNGGDAVICKNAAGQETIELLDKVEAERKGLKIKIPGSTLREKVVTFIERYKKLEAYQSEKVASYALELLAAVETTDLNKLTFDDGVLFDVPDSHEVSIPANCRKEQLIIRETPRVQGDIEYTIQKALWNRLDIDNQALAISHEALFKNFNNGNSRFARSMNRFLNSEQGNSASPHDFYKYFSENITRFATEWNRGAEPELYVFPNDPFNSFCLPNCLIETATELLANNCTIHNYALGNLTKNLGNLSNGQMVYSKANHSISYRDADVGFSETDYQIFGIRTFRRFTNGTVIFGHPYNRTPIIKAQVDSKGYVTIVTGHLKKVKLDDGRYFSNATQIELDRQGNIANVR